MEKFERFFLHSIVTEWCHKLGFNALWIFSTIVHTTSLFFLDYFVTLSVPVTSVNE